MTAMPWAKAMLCAALVFCGRSAAAIAPAHWEFGFSMATGMNSQLYSCFVVKVHDDRVIAKENITAEQFILQAKGLMKSKANPGNKDLFKEYGIELCGYEQASSVQEQIDACDPFAQVWCLRFQEWPFKDGGRSAHESGWAETLYAPSERQMLLLSEFGMHHFLDVIHGPAAFNLLRKLRDESWVANYRQGL